MWHLGVERNKHHLKQSLTFKARPVAESYAYYIYNNKKHVICIYIYTHSFILYTIYIYNIYGDLAGSLITASVLLLFPKVVVSISVVSSK